MTKEEILKQIKGSIIVSCQALPGEPLYVEDKSIMYLMARAAKEAGAKCIRTNSVRDVIAIKEETSLPVIGLIKVNYPGYESYITPTMKEVDTLATAGADIIAIDCTQSKRGDKITAPEFLKLVKVKYPSSIIMADISTLSEGIEAEKAGADLVGTTMSGYTNHSPKIEGPDIKLVKGLLENVSIPVIAEGRIHTPKEAKQMLELGAFAVVVGGAITRPYEIAKRFYDVL